MQWRWLGAACLGLSTFAAAEARAQMFDVPSGYGGFGGQYSQAPSLYYPYPGVIESRFGTYFTVPVVPGVIETPIEGATIDAANAAQAGIAPGDLAKADAEAKAVADQAEAAARRPPVNAGRARREARTQRAYAQGRDQTPAPFRRPLPRGSFEPMNNIPAGLPMYSPYARYQSYGQAYGMGPYGSNYYSGYWHGYAPMQGYPAGPNPIIP